MTRWKYRSKSLFRCHIIMSWNFITVHLLRYYYFFFFYWPKRFHVTTLLVIYYHVAFKDNITVWHSLFSEAMFVQKKKLFPHSPLKRDLLGGSNFFFPEGKKNRDRTNRNEMKLNTRQKLRRTVMTGRSPKGVEIKTKILFRRQNTSVCQARTRRNCFSLVTYYGDIYTYMCDCVGVDLNLCVYVHAIICVCVCVCMEPYYFPRDQSKSVN